MLDRKEAKEIAQFVLKELRKTSYPYATDAKLDYRKSGMGRAKGGTIGQIGPEYQHYVCDVEWTATGEDTITWSAGTVTLADGRSQALDAGGVTLTGTGLNYFWAVIGNSTIQTSTNYYDGVGDDKALLAFATKAPENDQLALIYPFFGTEPTFNSDVLSANMILAAHIKAGVITASHIQVGSITADRLSFEAFIVGSGTLDGVLDGSTYSRVLSTHIEAGKIKLVSETVVSGFTLDKVGDGSTYSRVLTTDIQSGHIKLSETVGSLDDIDNGATYGKILLTDISAGHILLSSVVQSSTYRTVADAEKSTWNSKPDDMDEIANGVTYQKVLTTDISSGHIKLTSYITANGTWYNYGGVTIDATTGITIVGGTHKTSAGTTRVELNSTGLFGYNSSTLQFYLQAADGKAYCGAGAVILDSAGIKVVGQFLSIRYSAGSILGSIYASNSTTMQLACSGDILIAPTGDLRLNTFIPSTSLQEIGEPANTWRDAHLYYCTIYTSLDADAAGGADIGSVYKFKNIYGTIILSTTYYAPEIEGMLCMEGSGGNDLYIYTSGAWRTNG